MAKRNLRKKGKAFRRILQILFLALTVWYLLNIIPNLEFALTFLVIFVLATLILRTGLCGWLCPFGTIFDGVNYLARKISGSILLKPLNIRYRKWVNNNRSMLNKIDQYTRFLKYMVLLLIVISVIYKIPTGHLIVLYLLIGLLILSIFVERAWCRYACPVGALVGLIGKLSPFVIYKDESKCTNCKLCNKVCPMNIDVASQIEIKNTDCMTCLDCVDICPVDNALEIKLMLPILEKQKSHLLDTADEKTAH